MTYHPHPLDTSSVTLPQELVDLTEVIAQHAHDIWAQQRCAAGWQYGPHRDDVRKEHPGLVPYDALDQAEKEYDRNTALETLKVIISLGYRLEKP